MPDELIAPLDAAPQDPPPQDPPPPTEPDDRPTLSVRILRDGPMGAVGDERSDLPADWLADHIATGAVEILPA